MNYRKLRIIILALTVPVVFVVVGVLKAVVRYFSCFFVFFIFISFAYAEVPSGGWATSIIRVQTPALCCPTTVTKTPSPVGSVVCRYTCANSEPGCFADTCTFVEYTTGGSSSYAYAGCNYAKPVDDISLCSDALKSAYYGGSAPSDFSCPAGKDSVGGVTELPNTVKGLIHIIRL